MCTDVHRRPAYFAERGIIFVLLIPQQRARSQQHRFPIPRTRAVASQLRQYLAGSNGSLGHDIEEKGESKVPKKRSSPPIMRLTIAIFVFLVLSGTSCIYAERSKSTTETSNPVTRKLFIDPSSTSVRLGKATLIVSPLSRRGGNYIGDYQLKVRPYFFKSETGTLVLGASEDFVRRLQSGRA